MYANQSVQVSLIGIHNEIQPAVTGHADRRVHRPLTGRLLTTLRPQILVVLVDYIVRRVVREVAPVGPSGVGVVDCVHLVWSDKGDVAAKPIAICGVGPATDSVRVDRRCCLFGAMPDDY